MEVAATASSLAPLRAANIEKRADAAARDFEAVFLAQMLAPLFSSVETPAIAGGGKSEEFFKSMMQDAYAKAMVERGGLGIAAHVKSTLIALQAAQSAPTPENQ